jgi:hypothetical protein
LLGGRPPYQGVNDLGRCQHPECHPRNAEPVPAEKPTRKEWEEFFRMAFAEGESWGVTYHGWFTPDEEHQEKAAQKAMHRCFEAMPGVPKL